MNMIEHLIQQLKDTDNVLSQASSVLAKNQTDEIAKINLDSIKKRRNDIESRLSSVLRITQTDLVQYHIERSTDRYPALSIANTISGFQELFTSVFDALRNTPKQRYRPSAESTELSTLDFSLRTNACSQCKATLTLLSPRFLRY
jgi:hypothetical protein